MPIVLFIIDNSASMGQRCYLGTRLLDVAKGAVETFIKMRQRDQGSRNDRYMLITFDEQPYSIKAAWKDGVQVLTERLKNLNAEGLTTMGQALRTAFDLLNVNRLITGIDTYGQGRSPFFLEPAMIITITDGGKLSNRNGIQDELQLPMASPLPGSELTKEPFRWDQRLFSLVLRLPATTTKEPEQLGSVPSDPSPISLMCEVTGGRSYSVTSQKTLMQCLDSLVQKAQSGVVIHFDKVDLEVKDVKFVIEATTNGNSQNKLTIPNNHDGPGSRSTSPTFNDPMQIGRDILGWTSLHRMIYVRPSPKSGMPAGHWPLPEAHWPDPNTPTLLPRTAHPILRFACIDTEPLLVQNFPYDKYELEPSPLTQVLLEKKNPNICWQVFVENSSKYGKVRYPCGYLKASSNLASVNLFVMPYNYTVLLPLIEELIKQKMKPHHQWKKEFDEYLKTIPSYYINPCRKALRQLGAPNLIPDLDSGLSHSVVMNFKTLRQKSKNAADALFNTVGMANPFANKSIPIQPKVESSLTQTDEVNEFPGFQINVQTSSTNFTSRTFHNAFDVPRSQLLSQLRKMKINFKRAISSSKYTRIRLQDREVLHNQPISQMGNFQEYAKTLTPPLRELDTDTPKRLHTFGNPFKLAKEKGMLVDETEDYDEPGSGGMNKRKSDRGRKGRSKRQRYNSYSGSSPHKPQNTFSPVSKSAPSSPAHTSSTENNVWELTNGELASHLNSAEPPLSKKRKLDNHENQDSEKIDQEVARITSNNSHSTENVECNGEKKINFNNNIDQLKRKQRTKTKHTTVKHKMDRDIHRVKNNVIKNNVIKLIREPGRHYNKIFNELNNLLGPAKQHQQILQILIIEAQRFKRENLVQLFYKFKNHHRAQNNSKNSSHKVER